LLVVLDNLDDLHDLGIVPKLVLERILKKCTPEQLFSLENTMKQPLEQVTDEYWKNHCSLKLKIDTTSENVLLENDCETWRDLYLVYF
jgi:superfamily II DNA/RNA helicase